MAVELYGINKSNVGSILTKNIFTTYVPVSAAIYLEDKGLTLPVMCIEKGEIAIKGAKFSELIGIKNGKLLHEIHWNSESRNPLYNKSLKAPGLDMGVIHNKEFLKEFEVKLTVVPTHAEDKITEMIVRQNTQFGFAERLSYHFGDLIEKTPTIETLKNIVDKSANRQSLFILHGVWKTKGHSAVIDQKNAFDVIAITDIAYLKMLLNCRLEKDTSGKLVKTRIGRVLDQIVDWLKEYKAKGKITYRDETEGSRDHLKITLYPYQHQTKLKSIYYGLRLSFKDLQKIVPEDSIKKLSPERRLDASIIFTLANQELDEN